MAHTPMRNDAFRRLADELGESAVDDLRRRWDDVFKAHDPDEGETFLIKLLNEHSRFDREFADAVGQFLRDKYDA